ncbi:phosphoribosylanthranilate isomerase [Dokdonella sp.]|uniref:phosphoribosylanthranilate isomerase n=1 Tax=Dokdonella sp. TaxID=2291710 RepID=UPI003783DFF9
MTTRIKFCGITRPQDARFAIELGVDAIGLVFTRRSQRFLGISQAREIRRMLPPFMSAVALFMDDAPSWIEEVIAGVQPDLLQFHGAEAGPFAASFSRPYVKVVPMASIDDAAAYVGLHPAASGFVLDSHALGALGGTGETFDWKRAPRIGKPTILAGGLDPGNVAQAIALVRPYAVDVSSGIETASGIKESGKMRRFVEAVRAADG